MCNTFGASVGGYVGFEDDRKSRKEQGGGEAGASANKNTAGRRCQRRGPLGDRKAYGIQ